MMLLIAPVITDFSLLQILLELESVLGPKLHVVLYYLLLFLLSYFTLSFRKLNVKKYDILMLIKH